MSHELLGSVVMERGKENIETEKMILEALSFIKDSRLKDCGWCRLLIDINSSKTSWITSCLGFDWKNDSLNIYICMETAQYACEEAVMIAIALCRSDDERLQHF
jgi:hypothetical protein